MTTQHQLFSDTLIDKQIAQCYQCPYGTHKIEGGGSKMELVRVNAERGGSNYEMDIWYDANGRYLLENRNKGTNRVRRTRYGNIDELRRNLERYAVEKYEVIKRKK